MKTLFFNAAAWRDPGPVQRNILLWGVCLACLALLARYQLHNGLTILPGDRYDVVISTTILEHWFLFFTGHADWSQVNYFYPYTRTIAQTDAYFLLGVAYAPFRLAGVDPFLAAEFSSFAVRACGFIFCYLLLRRAFSFSFYWALLAAALFTLSNGLAAHSSRVQLVSVGFAPLISLLLWNTITAFMEGQAQRFRRYGLGAGLLYGAWCLTCFYIAWYFTFFFTVAMVVMLARAGTALRKQALHQLAAQFWSVLVVLAGTVLAMAPFVYAFLPKSQEVGVRAYDSVLGNTIPWQDVMQVGTDNLLFGRLYNSALKMLSPTYAPAGEYANTGFAPILFVLFVAGCVQLLRKGMRREKVVLSSLALAALLTWGLAMRFGDYSGWYLVYNFFPGAKALNVVAVYQLFLALPVVIIAVRYLSNQRMGMPIALLLGALLVAEELTKPYLNLDRHAELKRLVLPSAPPLQCKVFYVSGWEGQDTLGGFPEPINNGYAHNVSAMMIAQSLHIPTINGVASFSPVDWNFGVPNRADYDDRVMVYAKNHNVRSLCKLDLNNKTWRMIDDQKILNVPDLNHHYFKTTAWPGVIVADRGFATAEPWGVWSKEDTASFTFSEPFPQKFTLQLRGYAFGRNVGREFTVQIGDEERRFTLSTENDVHEFDFTNTRQVKSLTIHVPAAVSPKEMGIGNDARRLGIGITEMRIVP